MSALRLGAAVFLIVAVNLYDLGTFSASVPRWVVLYAWAVLAFPVLVFLSPRPDRVDWAAICVLLYAALSLGWSSDRLASVHALTNMTSLLVIFLWVRRNPQWIGEAATVAVAVTLAMQFIAPQDWGGHGNRSFQAEAMIIGLAIGCRWWLWWPVAISAIGYLVTSNPGKIVYFAAIALGAYWIGVAARNWRIAHGKGGTLAQQPDGMAGQTLFRPRHRGF